MGISKITGVVIKEVNLKESDKIITVFTKEMGKVQLYAKRARDIKSPFLAGTQLCVNADFLYTSKGNINFLNQISILNAFPKIRFDIDKLYYAMYFLEFLDKTVELESPSEEMYDFLVKTLQRLNDAKEDIKLIRIIYELKMLSMLGYAPEVTRCIRCDSDIESDFYYFSLDDCGVLCEDCVEKNDRVIKASKTTIYAMQYIIYIELNKIFLFTLDSKILRELKEITDELLKINICQTFRTLDFLNEV